MVEMGKRVSKRGLFCYKKLPKTDEIKYPFPPNYNTKLMSVKNSLFSCEKVIKNGCFCGFASIPTIPTIST